MTRYGPPRIIWFDGLNNQRKYDGERVIKMIRELQPATLVNDRIGVDADYETPEQFIPTAIPTKGIELTGIDPKVSKRLKKYVPRPEDFRLWETCMTINNTWAYNKNDRDFKSEQTLIRSLVEVASRGGNFLLNVGPQPDGQIQPEFQQRLHAIGDWLTLNGDSIYGTTYGPVQGVAGLRTTAKDKSIYRAHIRLARFCRRAISGIEAESDVGSPACQRKWENADLSADRRTTGNRHPSGAAPIRQRQRRNGYKNFFLNLRANRSDEPFSSKNRLGADLQRQGIEPETARWVFRLERQNAG